MSKQTIICGDSYKLASRYIDDNTVIVTDPPYNIKYHYKTYKDNKRDDDYWNDLVRLFSLCPSVVVMYPEALYVLAAKMGKIPQKVCSWFYTANTPKQHRDIAYFDVRPDFKLYRQPYKNMNDKRVQELYKKTGGARSYDWFACPQVKNVNKDDGGIGIVHPCQMPVDVMKWVVGILPPNCTIIDPFCGSGSTGVACRELDRDFIGIELDADYCELSRARLK